MNMPSLLPYKFYRWIVLVCAIWIVGPASIQAQKVRLRSQITPACDSGASNLRFADIFADGNIAVQGGYACRGAFIYDITNPAAPVFKWEINPVDTVWVHAMHIRGNRMYLSGWGGKIEIYDISNLATQAPALIGAIAGDTNNHSTWTSEDGNYLYSCRELVDGDLRVYDVRDPAAPLLVRSIKASDLGLNAVSPHNPVVMGNFLYVSWYQAGIQVFDITDPAFP